MKWYKNFVFFARQLGRIERGEWEGVGERSSEAVPTTCKNGGFTGGREGEGEGGISSCLM